MKKFWNFSKSKNRKIWKNFFSTQNVFFIPPRSKLGHFEEFPGQKSQFKNFDFFNLEKIWKLGVPLKETSVACFLGLAPKTCHLINHGFEEPAWEMPSQE